MQNIHLQNDHATLIPLTVPHPTCSHMYHPDTHSQHGSRHALPAWQKSLPTGVLIFLMRGRLKATTSAANTPADRQSSPPRAPSCLSTPHTSSPYSLTLTHHLDSRTNQITNHLQIILSTMHHTFSLTSPTGITHCCRRHVLCAHPFHQIG